MATSLGLVRSLALAAAVGCSRASPSADPSAAPVAPTLTPQVSGTRNRLQAVSPVNERVVWASGVGGTYALTTDGGTTWRAAVVPGADSLEFRDVEGVSERVAYLLAAGPGDRSRIYRTDDGGRSWSLQFVNRDTSAFYDCFAFWNERSGFTMSDAVNGRFPVLRTAANRIAVMYQGKIVELGPTEIVVERPEHPYTQALMSSVLAPEPAYANTRIEGMSSFDRSLFDAPAVIHK